MKIKYVENFGDCLNEEVIEIKIVKMCVYIEAIISGDSSIDAINKFFDVLLYHQKKNIMSKINMPAIRTYALTLYNKGKNSRKNNLLKYGYSWSIEQISNTNIYYMQLSIDTFKKSKYTLLLKEVLAAREKGECLYDLEQIVNEIELRYCMLKQKMNILEGQRMGLRNGDKHVKLTGDLVNRDDDLFLEMKSTQEEIDILKDMLTSVPWKIRGK